MNKKGKTKLIEYIMWVLVALAGILLIAGIIKTFFL